MHERDFIKLTLSHFVAEIYEDVFNALGLYTKVRLLPRYVKVSNLISLHN